MRLLVGQALNKSCLLRVGPLLVFCVLCVLFLRGPRMLQQARV